MDSLHLTYLLNSCCASVL